jgi:hypothetical protein
MVSAGESGHVCDAASRHQTTLQVFAQFLVIVVDKVAVVLVMELKHDIIAL